MDRQEVKMIGCLLENSVGKASGGRETLCVAVLGDLPLRDGVPREGVVGDATCIGEYNLDEPAIVDLCVL